MRVARGEVLLAAVLFGTTGTAQALGPDASTAATVGAARLVVGGAALAALALAIGQLRGPWPPRLLLPAGAGVALYQLSFFAAVDRTGVAVGAVVAIGSGPVLAGLGERLVDGVWPDRRWLLATALAIAGVVTLAFASASDTSLDASGIALALLSGAGYAMYTLVAKRLLRDGREPIGVMGASFGIGAVLLLPVLAFGDTAWLREPGGVALALYLGLVPTLLAYVLFARGLRSLAASEVTTLVLAEPVTATLLGALVLDERIGAPGAVGVALVFAGLAVLAFPQRARTARTHPETWPA